MCVPYRMISSPPGHVKIKGRSKERTDKIDGFRTRRTLHCLPGADASPVLGRG
jgi:hypothetical protein